MNPRVIVERLLTEPKLLAVAAEGIFAPSQQLEMLRPRPQSGQFPWSEADLPLVAEAAHVIAGRSASFSHVVIDEAQDLSAMQWQVVLRRCGRRSLTILGDLAQATAPGASTSWHELVERLGLADETTIAELRVGYRVPDPILQFACRLLPAAAPGVEIPTSIRGGDDPHIKRVSPSQIDMAVLEATASGDGQTAIVAPETQVAPISSALRDAGYNVGDTTASGLTAQVVVLSAEGAKGLEFDHVIVVEPRALAGRTRRGSRLLFIALTRATKRLTIIHSDPLPRALTDDSATPDDNGHGTAITRSATDVLPQALTSSDGIPQNHPPVTAAADGASDSLSRALLAGAAAPDDDRHGTSAPDDDTYGHSAPESDNIGLVAGAAGATGPESLQQSRLEPPLELASPKRRGLRSIFRRSRR